jgi:hypothetical protein
VFNQVVYNHQIIITVEKLYILEHTIWKVSRTKKGPRTGVWETQDKTICSILKDKDAEISFRVKIKDLWSGFVVKIRGKIKVRITGLK